MAKMLNLVELENEWLKATVLPEVGCKIQSLLWKPAAKEILWQNPRIRPRRYPIDANFDNYWSGGWDDAFPTCEACDYAGEHYPNLGELRSVEWSIEEVHAARARFRALGPISPVRAEKTVILEADAPVVRIRYRIENLGPLPVDFLWGTHPALSVNERTLLRIPGKTGIVGQSSSPALGSAGQRYAWPHLGVTDMSRVQPATAGAFCGHYVTDLEAGWFAAEDTSTCEGVLFGFPAEICRNLWLWMVYGGWRGYHHVVMEPWTGMPVTLDQAAAQGTSRRLEAGAEFAVEVRATPYRSPETWQQALERVERIR